MKALKFIWIVLIGASFTAYGGTKSIAQATEPVTADPYTYVLDGQPTSAESLQNLSHQGTHLTYFVPSNWDGKTLQVFSTETGVKAFQQRDQHIQAQGFCISLRTKSTFYDGENYVGRTLVVPKNTTYQDLSTIGTPTSWDNDISSVKGADCVYTYLYDDAPLGVGLLSVIISPGQNLSSMPSPHNTGAGLSTISALAVQ